MGKNKTDASTTVVGVGRKEMIQGRHRVQHSTVSTILLAAVCFMGIGLVAEAFGAQTAVSSAIAQADSYYCGRSNLDNVRKALALIRDEVAAHPKSYEAWWRIAEFDCYLARHLPSKQQEPVLEDGIEAGKKAEELAPERPEGHFWTGADEGLLGERRGLWGGLHFVDLVRHEMQTVMKVAPGYEEDGAQRLLGRLYYEAPFFMGGNKELSVRMLEDCLKRYPNNSLTMLYLADSYRSTGRREDARRMLERILSLSQEQEPDKGPELADNQAEARRELKKFFRADV